MSNIYCSIAFVGSDGSLCVLNFENEEVAKNFAHNCLWDRPYLVGNIKHDDVEDQETTDDVEDQETTKVTKKKKKK